MNKIEWALDTEVVNRNRRNRLQLKIYTKKMTNKTYRKQRLDPGKTT